MIRTETANSNNKPIHSTNKFINIFLNASIGWLVIQFFIDPFVRWFLTH